MRQTRESFACSTRLSKFARSVAGSRRLLTDRQWRLIARALSCVIRRYDTLASQALSEARL